MPFEKGVYIYIYIEIIGLVINEMMEERMGNPFYFQVFRLENEHGIRQIKEVE